MKTMADHLIHCSIATPLLLVGSTLLDGHMASACMLLLQMLSCVCVLNSQLLGAGGIVVAPMSPGLTGCSAYANTLRVCLLLSVERIPAQMYNGIQQWCVDTQE